MAEKVDFAPGMRILVRGEEWRVQKVEVNTLGNHALYCMGISDLVKDREAIFLDDLETIVTVDPAKVRLVTDPSDHYRHARLYIESQLRQRIPTDTAIHIGDEAVMDPMPYQLEPAALALSRPRQRILIADSVGLGKTLEAGILLSELIVRGKGKRILVVTVKSMMAQFQKEMWDRFTIPLVRLDSARIARIRRELPSNANPFFYYDKAIVSIDTLKRDVEYRVHLENAHWDVIVIDEAQNVADRGNQAQRAKLAKLLAEKSDSLILLSATPHDGKPRSFASLMNMLDPTAIADPDHYTKDNIKGLFIRRFKKDIKDQMKGKFLEREVHTEHCEASPEEEAAFDIVSNLDLAMDRNARKGAGQLFKTGLLKSLFSSPAACLATIRERLRKLAKKQGVEGDVDQLEELERAVSRIDAPAFSKYQHLLTLLRSSAYHWTPHAKDDRIVIFTERIETMKWVARKLREDLDMDDNQVVELSGAMSDQEQQEKVENFGRENAPVRILVASDVASEGLNLHYLSHRLIHFDIPWSLIVFQQRNGRIDRYGQKQKPDIRYLLCDSDNPSIKGDNRIMEILISKEQNAHENIGDPVSLMGKFDVDAENQVTAGVIERGAHEEDMENQFTETAESFDALDYILNGAVEEEEEGVTVIHDRTLMSDADYLTGTLDREQIPYQVPRDFSGVKIQVDDDARARLSHLMPAEALPKGSWLNLSDDKTFCAQEMVRGMENRMTENAWSDTQYLWALHPLLAWLGGKNAQIFHRGEAPLLGIRGKMDAADTIFLLEGSVPNRRSTPVVDEWFGALFHDGQFQKMLPMEEVIRLAGLDDPRLINGEDIEEPDLAAAQQLVASAVAEAARYMQEKIKDYKDRMAPEINGELEKLGSLEAQHKQFVQGSLFSEKIKAEKERDVDRIFEDFVKWVHETLEIEDKPYLRIIAVLKGVTL